jgi:folate-binding protein YgfZ
VFGMSSLPLREFHESLAATFTTVNGAEAVAHYGQPLVEYRALHETAGVLDLSFRGRLCLIGNDRHPFLNGQVTNNVKDLPANQGVYAAIVSAKGKMQADAYIYNLGEELLLDLEPGLGSTVTTRLEKYIIADDVQVVDAAPHYGLLSVQGPQAATVVNALELGATLPTKELALVAINHAMLGQLYVMNISRTGTVGYDLYVPVAALGAVLDKLITSAKAVGGGIAGWDALELARIEAGIPRFGKDMDETNLPPEAGIEKRAISYTKGCYIGQEIIARIRTYGQVAKALRGLKLPDDLPQLPEPGTKLYQGEREAGYVTSAVWSPVLRGNIALGYVRREANQVGTELRMRMQAGDYKVDVVNLPFSKSLA